MNPNKNVSIAIKYDRIYYFPIWLKQNPTV